MREHWWHFLVLNKSHQILCGNRGNTIATEQSFNMLLQLVVLFAGGLALCGAQTDSFVTTTSSTTPSTVFLVQPTSVVPSPDSTDNAMVYLQAAVQSSQELNDTTAASALHQFFAQLLQQEKVISVKVKNITRV